MCVAVVGQFSMVLACGVQCLSVNTCVPCELCCFKSLARGVHQPDRHQHKTRDGWLFFLFCFVFHGTRCFATARCLRLNAWVFFLFFFHVTLLRVCFVRLKKNVGICNVWVMFFSKTGQFNDTCCQNIPVWIFDTTPSFFASVCLM